jgi:hypothetical protein
MLPGRDLVNIARHKDFHQVRTASSRTAIPAGPASYPEFRLCCRERLVSRRA